MWREFLTLRLACLIVTYIADGTRATGLTRELYARAPLEYQKLDTTPIKTILSTSRVKCLTQCAGTSGCVAFNFGVSGECELLDTYLCQDNTASLVPSTDYTYYDVEDSVENIGIYDSKDFCRVDGKCSPKCAASGQCEWTSQFEETPNKYIVGYTKDDVSDVTVDQCKQHCVAATTFLCKSADYSRTQSKCFMSHLNKDDAPDIFLDSVSHTYLHRICE